MLTDCLFLEAGSRRIARDCWRSTSWERYFLNISTGKSWTFESLICLCVPLLREMRSLYSSKPFLEAERSSRCTSTLTSSSSKMLLRGSSSLRNSYTKSFKLSVEFVRRISLTSSFVVLDRNLRMPSTYEGSSISGSKQAHLPSWGYTLYPDSINLSWYGSSTASPRSSPYRSSYCSLIALWETFYPLLIKWSLSINLLPKSFLSMTFSIYSKSKLKSRTSEPFKAHPGC